MLNSFEYYIYIYIYKIYVHIFYCILDSAWPKLMKFTLEQHYMFSVLHSQ